jgi:hypothetical protein
MIINTLNNLTMRKIFLFMLVIASTLSLNSCSKDDNNQSPPSSNSVTMKVGGTQKTFNTIEVKQEPYTLDGENFIDLIITASINGNMSESLTFYVGKGDVGSGVSWGFNYIINDVVFFEDGVINSVNTNTTVNSDKKLVGTFDGIVTASDGTSLELTQGLFDISY